jgi:hypothetical protein
MNETTRLVFHILAIAALGVALWALLHFTAPKRQGSEKGLQFRRANETR